MRVPGLRWNTVFELQYSMRPKISANNKRRRWSLLTLCNCDICVIAVCYFCVLLWHIVLLLCVIATYSVIAACYCDILCYCCVLLWHIVLLLCVIAASYCGILCYCIVLLWHIVLLLCFIVTYCVIAVCYCDILCYFCVLLWHIVLLLCVIVT